MSELLTTLNPYHLGLSVLSFLLGSIPFGIFITRVFGKKNLQNEGSGNIGATNVARVVGFWPAGFLTLFLDVSKGALPVALASSWGVAFWGPWIGAGDLEIGKALLWSCGLLAVLGHCYSPWIRFQGGKGVATAFGALFVLTPIAAGLGLLIFIMVFLQKRIASLSSLSAMGFLLASDLALYSVDVHSWILGLIIFLIMLRHEANIDALLAETEKPVF